MNTQRIELIIRNLHKEDFFGLLLDYFCNDRSPNFPIRVYCKWITVRGKPVKVVLNEDSFRIVEEPKDVQQEIGRTLARIILQVYTSRLVIFIEGEDNEAKDWDKVIGITKNILTKIQQFDGEIISVDPVELMPVNLNSIEGKSIGQNASGKHKANKVHTEETIQLKKEFKGLGIQTQDRYRRAILLIEEFENNMLDSYKKKDTDSIKVKEKEMVAYIKEKMGWSISTRTLRRIKQYADVILLEDTDNL